MTAIDELLHRAAARRPAVVSDQAPPALRLAIVTCMDARLDLGRILGLAPGEAHVIRNAGGTVTDDVIRSLALSQRLLGTREVIVIAHTGCGLEGLEEQEFLSDLEHDAGVRPSWEPHAFTDVDSHVRGSLRRLADSPFAAQGRARGFVYHVESGQLREVA